MTDREPMTTQEQIAQWRRLAEPRQRSDIWYQCRACLMSSTHADAIKHLDNCSHAALLAACDEIDVQETALVLAAEEVVESTIVEICKGCEHEALLEEYCEDWNADDANSICLACTLNRLKAAAVERERQGEG